jgi:hypothetical protein
LPQKGLVWGGDWNHTLTGHRNGGSDGGRSHILTAIESLNLRAPTSDMLHRNGHPTIDHIAVPSGWWVKSKKQVAAEGLSDHDAYVVEAYDRDRWISENAYFRWSNEGCPGGRDWGHWFDAEHEFESLE